MSKVVVRFIFKHPSGWNMFKEYLVETEFISYLESLPFSVYFNLSPIIDCFSNKYVTEEVDKKSVLCEFDTACSSSGYCTDMDCYICGNLYQKWCQLRGLLPLSFPLSYENIISTISCCFQDIYIPLGREVEFLIFYLQSVDIQKKVGVYHLHQGTTRYLCIAPYFSDKEVQPILLEKQDITIYFLGEQIDISLQDIPRDPGYSIPKGEISLITLTKDEKKFIRCLNDPYIVTQANSKIKELVAILFYFSLPSYLPGLKVYNNVYFLSKETNKYREETKKEIQSLLAPLSGSPKESGLLKYLDHHIPQCEKIQYIGQTGSFWCFRSY